VRWTFDVNANALYVYLTDDRPARQVDLGSGIIADVAADDSVSGVELLNPHATPLLMALETMGVPVETLQSIVFLASRPFAGMHPSPAIDLTEMALSASRLLAEESLHGVVELVPS
jgi:uncharacterized protein YuzE